MVECRISYRHRVITIDGIEVVRIDPEGRGEVWRGGELLLRLAPELMAIYEAALLRQFLRQPPDPTWQLVDNDAA